MMSTLSEFDPLWFDRVRASLAGCRNAGMIVAVSGGGDSMGLLRSLPRSVGDVRPSVESDTLRPRSLQPRQTSI